jgi:hypothetical protein
MLRLRLSRHRRPRGRAAVLGIAFLAIGMSGSTARTVFAIVESDQATRESWSLTLRVSGGIAGLNREMELASSGSATVTDLRRNRQVRRQILPEELLEIDRLVGAAVSLDVPDQTQCRDCLSYSVELRRRGQQLTIRANDDSLSASKIAPLVHALSRLQNRLLAEP